jgi:hypothetical protein
MIVALSGYARSGKDTVAEIITRHNPIWKVKKFSGKLKQVASILTGIPPSMFEDQKFKEQVLHGWDRKRWEGRLQINGEVHADYYTKETTVRDFLQRLGTDAIRNVLHENAWVNALFSEYYNTDNWIITDCRFPNEYEAVKNWGGVVIRVDRPNITPVNAHVSETALDLYEFDYTIVNKGTLEDLEETTLMVYENIISYAP